MLTVARPAPAVAPASAGMWEIRVRASRNARVVTRPVWPRKVRTSFPVPPSHTFTVLSSPAVATRRPSGLKATA